MVASTIADDDAIWAASWCGIEVDWLITIVLGRCDAGVVSLEVARTPVDVFDSRLTTPAGLASK